MFFSSRLSLLCPSVDSSNASSVKGDSFGNLEVIIVVSVSVGVLCIALIILILARQYVRRRARAKREKRQKEALARTDDVESNRSMPSSPRSATRADNTSEGRTSPWQDLPNCYVPESCGTLLKRHYDADERLSPQELPNCYTPKVGTLPREHKEESKRKQTPSPTKASPKKEKLRRARAGSATPTLGTRHGAHGDIEMSPWQDLPNCYVPKSCTLPRQHVDHSGLELRVTRPTTPTSQKEMARLRAGSTTPTSGMRCGLPGRDSPDSVFGAVTPLALVLSASDSGHGSVPGSPVDESDLNDLIQYRPSPTSGWSSLDRRQLRNRATSPHGRTRLYSNPQKSEIETDVPDMWPWRTRAFSTSAMMASEKAKEKARQKRRDVDIDELLVELDIQKKQSVTNRHSQHHTVTANSNSVPHHQLGVVPPVVTVHGWPQREEDPVYSYDRLQDVNVKLPVGFCRSRGFEHRIDADVDLPPPPPPSELQHFYDLPERQHLDV